MAAAERQRRNTRGRVRFTMFTPDVICRRLRPIHPDVLLQVRALSQLHVCPACTFIHVHSIDFAFDVCASQRWSRAEHVQPAAAPPLHLLAAAGADAVEQVYVHVVVLLLLLLLVVVMAMIKHRYIMWCKRRHLLREVRDVAAPQLQH